MKMPPVIPRLSFTYITKKTSKLLENLALDPTFVLNNNVAEIKANWLLSQQQPPLQILMEQLKEDFAKSHKPLRELDRKSTRLNSSHVATSYAVFCSKKK